MGQMPLKYYKDWTIILCGLPSLGSEQNILVSKASTHVNNFFKEQDWLRDICFSEYSNELSNERSRSPHYAWQMEPPPRCFTQEPARKGML